MRRKSSAFSARLADDLGHLLPSVFAFTITLGVAPLLFLQVMYGQFLYASSILIGVPWLAIIAMVILAYYGVYFFSMKGHEHRARRRQFWLWWCCCLHPLPSSTATTSP